MQKTTREKAKKCTYNTIASYSVANYLISKITLKMCKILQFSLIRNSTLQRNVSTIINISHFIEKLNTLISSPFLNGKHLCCIAKHFQGRLKALEPNNNYIGIMPLVKPCEPIHITKSCSGKTSDPQQRNAADTHTNLANFTMS